MMDQLSFPPVFESITQELIETLMDAETVLETMVRVDKQDGQPFKLRLKEEYLLLYRCDQEETGPIAFLHLDFSVKF